MSDWINWNGGTCPVLPDTYGMVKLRSGTVTDLGRIDNLDWASRDSDGDIVAYQVADKPAEPVATPTPVETTAPETPAPSAASEQPAITTPVANDVPVPAPVASVATVHDPANKPSRADEFDPTGADPHKVGAKLDGGKIRADLVLSGMPRALLAVAEIATFGAAKYTENGWVDVPEGFKRYTAAMDRHRLKETLEEVDADSGLSHQAHLAWNALARLELMLRKAPHEGWNGH